MNPARIHFETLPAEQKREALLRLHALGYGDYEIAAASGIAVEQVRRELGKMMEAKAVVE